MKRCKTCGYPKHDPEICDLATLESGRVVHVSRLNYGADIYMAIQRGEEKVANRWKKDEPIKKVRVRRS
jgi:hypothetical protein